MKVMGLSSFDEYLAWTCAPVLLEKKIANLVCIPVCEEKNYASILQNYRSFFKSRNIEYRVMCFCSKRCLILIYNRDMLAEALSDKGNRAFLIANGYEIDANIDKDLNTLEKRMRDSDKFPHEIGVFLGYPLEDILGFVLNNGSFCKYKGYWKVYGDVSKAKELFSSYERYKNYLLNKISKGISLINAVEQFKEVV